MNVKYSFANMLPSARRLFDFLDTNECEEKKLLVMNNSEIDIQSTNGEIEFEDVNFSYEEGGKKILQQISFKIAKGEKIAIIGSNGSGKTTMINLLLRFYKPQKGRILVDGININTIKLTEYRRLVSAVTQNPYLFNTTILNNILMKKAYRKKEYDEALLYSQSGDFVSIDDDCKQNIGNNGVMLSGGQKQKLAIARALYKNSKILILDEATANFDIASEENLFKAIQNTFVEKTIIYITHKINILKYVDRVIWLEKGKVHYIGTYDDLCETMLYEKLMKKMM
jgi:ATP-binding cassette subfamily B protein